MKNRAKKLIIIVIVACTFGKYVQGMSKNVYDTSLDEPLLDAAGDDLSKVEGLLAQHANPNAHDSDGNTALILVARKSNAPTEIIKKLIDAGVDLDAQNNCGETALMRAASNGTAQVVKLLLKAGSNVFLLDRSGKNALYWASSMNRDFIVQILAQAASSKIAQEWQDGAVETSNLIVDYCW